MISPTNQPKHTISPTGRRKAKVALWGDAVATWGDAWYAWGFESESYLNQDKTLLSANLQLEDVTDFLLEDSSLLQLEGGSGALVWTNIDKN